MGKNIISRPVSSGIKVKGVADVVFCFDCTGSMSSCIDNVKNNVKSFVEGLGADQSVIIDWRMRALGYGDLEIGEAVQNDNDFVSTIPEFQAQVDNIAMCGGGDAPESTLDAIIYAAKTSKWREKSHKIVVVFTDAPTKNVHPDTQKMFAVNNIKDLKTNLSEDHVKLFLWGASDPNYNELKAVPKAEITVLGDPYSYYATGDKMENLLKLMGKTVSAESLIKSDTL